MPDSDLSTDESRSRLRVKVREVHEKRGNCTMAMRVGLWLLLEGDDLDISPANFHRSVARWLAASGLVSKRDIEEVSAVLYCLGVVNSNNLFQKVHQGKAELLGIGRNGRINSRGRKRQQG